MTQEEEEEGVGGEGGEEKEGEEARRRKKQRVNESCATHQFIIFFRRMLVCDSEWAWASGARELRSARRAKHLGT